MTHKHRVEVLFSTAQYKRLELCATHEDKNSIQEVIRNAVSLYLDNHPKSTLFPQ